MSKKLTVLALILCALSSCSSSRPESASVGSSSPSRARSAQAEGSAGGSSDAPEALVGTAAAQSNAAAATRKIIRNAELVVESEATDAAYKQIASLAESNGGFVVESEASQRGESTDPGKQIVSTTVRVPAAQFEATIESIRRLGSRVLQDRRTGQDVTEEYIDLEARVLTKKALEAQFLEIMKRAEKVSDALEVQRQLAEVRGEIERVEGRRRFLENQSALSTIKVTLRPPPSLVGGETGFFSGIREAIGDGVSAAVTIVLVLIRIVVAMLPVVLFVLLPLFLLGRYLLRRRRRTTVK